MTLRHVRSHGLSWVVNDETDDHLGPSGHEDFLVTIARQLLPETGGTFVDVGAHVGLYALRLGAFRAKKVIAVEANPRTFDTLCENIILNDLENVYPRNLAAWHTTGKDLQMYDAHSLESGGSTGAVKIGDARPVGTARTTTLDDLLDGEDRVDLIKIDVEGAEADVLAGAQHVLDRFRPKLMIEMHDAFLPYPELNRLAVEQHLEDAGYVHGAELPYGHGYHLICRPHEEDDAA